MTRTAFLSVVLLGCSVLAAIGGLRSTPAAHALTASRAPAEPRFAHPLRPARDCKPLAPVALSLEQTAAQDGSVVDLRFEVSPHADVGPVSWELLLPAGSVLLDGERSGSCAAENGGSGPRHARVRLGTSGSLARVTLLASGALAEGAPHGERIEASTSLSWGDPSADFRAALAGRALANADRADRAGSTRLVEVPTSHRSGR